MDITNKSIISKIEKLLIQSKKLKTCRDSIILNKPCDCIQETKKKLLVK